MTDLFKIETEQIELAWRLNSTTQRSIIKEASNRVEGRLEIRLLGSAVLKNCHRQCAPAAIESDIEYKTGPPLFEETDYIVYLESKTQQRVKLLHTDPNVCRSLHSEKNERIVHGTINFRSEVGFCRFTVVVDDKPELEFEVEVFPTKLDYKSDYEKLLAETQDYVYGLIYEYLRSTYSLSKPILEKRSGNLEWLLLLKMVIEDLERGITYISHNPIRSLTREQQFGQASKIKRLEPLVRKAVSRGAGSGSFGRISESIEARQKLPYNKTTFTTNTSEHKWISTQLRLIRDRLLDLRAVELNREKTARRNAIAEDLRKLEQRVLRLQQLEPFRGCTELPPPGFASLQLLTAPGYRECYKACNVLNLGLRIEKGIVDLSLKEISLLYEYWCYLTVVHTIAKISDQPMPVNQLVKSKHSSLEIQLKKGIESKVTFGAKTGHSISIFYNRQFESELALVSQRPDIMIRLGEEGWPGLDLLLDAKYRIRTEPEYLKQYDGPGPDIEAINVLHRYRDAILESKTQNDNSLPKRSVVQAAALFPYVGPEYNSYKSCRLWAALDRLGIGAIPLLPNSKQYIEEWLTNSLSQGGWALADKVIGHQATELSNSWRQASSEAALIGVLKPEIAQQHLDWILQHKIYYMPLRKGHSRQLSAKWVAIYSPAGLSGPGAVTHQAKVEAIDVIKRTDIDTPWPASEKRVNDMHVVYSLGQIEKLKRPIKNITQSGRGQRFSTPRWASKLSLQRAKDLPELFLESESEWRLYEGLQAAKVGFTLEPVAPSALSIDEESWRVWFITDSGTRIRYGGASGFIAKHPDGTEQSYLTAAAAVKQVSRKSTESFTVFNSPK